MFKREKLIAPGLVAVCLAAIVILPSSCTARLKRSVARFYSPPLRASSAMADAVRTGLERTKSRAELLEENRHLRSELSRLRFESARLQEAAAENQRLRMMLRFKETSHLNLLAARVIGRDTSNWWRSIRIDRGSVDGVTVNTAVVSPQGLVGKVVVVGRTESEVLLAVDRGCRVSVLIQASGEPGLLMGSPSESVGAPQCRLTFVSKQAKVDVGAPVVTSGMGGVFPPGLPVGTISRVLGQKATDAAGLYQEAEVSTSVNFKMLTEVFVIVKGQ